MDWWPEGPLARASYVIRCTDGNDWKFTSAGFPGAVGVVTGLSSRGFAVILNAVTAPDPVCKTGYPVLLHLRRVVEDAADFDDALAMLSKQRLTTSAPVHAGRARRTTSGWSSSGPRSGTPCGWARPNEPLITTNDYRLLDRPAGGDAWDLERTELHAVRTGCATWRAASRPARRRTMRNCSTGCRTTTVRQEITAQHVLIRPARGEMQLFVPRGWC